MYWGRFNPPHQGHLEVIRKFRKDYDLIVAVGSSEHKDEKVNPFSGAERKAMLEAYLKESRIRGVRVVTLKDGPSASWAVGNLIRKCRPDLVLLSTEKSALADLAERRLPVVRFRRTGTVSSTRIRDAIASGDSRWKTLTGRSVANLIEQRDGVRRIQKAYGRRGSVRRAPHRGPATANAPAQP